MTDNRRSYDFDWFNTGRRTLSGSVAVTVPLLGTAIWLWILDILGIDGWVAERIANFINLVASHVG